jgi:hypothetical protein
VIRLTPSGRTAFQTYRKTLTEVLRSSESAPAKRLRIQEA